MKGLVSIREIQGDALFSPYAGKPVETQGVITGVLRQGFYIQTPDVTWDGQCSDAIFVFGDTRNLQLGYLVRVAGKCLDFLKHDAARPVTQIKVKRLKVLEMHGPQIKPLMLSPELLPKSNEALAAMLNSLEGMLLTIPAQSTFIAPSNRYGDYVCALPFQLSEPDIIQTKEGGVIVDAANINRWFPGFRIRDYQIASKLNVGSTLLSDVVGPLHYRVDAWQIAAQHRFKFDNKSIVLEKSRIQSSDGALTIFTLNCFNLDWKVESAARVHDPRRDIDDDWGDGRFHALAQAVVLQANTPDIVALQEIQDNDGAELTEVVDASKTYTALILLIKQLSGVEYKWVDIPPDVGADGGQPGGNIRNGYFYNPARVALVENSVQLIGADKSCFVDSRKPVMAVFMEKASGKSLAIINLHLISKREQLSIFAPQDPGVDKREAIRIEQANVIHAHTEKLLDEGQDYYITGDFNDNEHSKTLNTLVGESNFNLVVSLPPATRYDYNHRGKLQVLMHGILPKHFVDEGRVDYEIIHGNELIGVEPGVETDKPSDHAYVLAKIALD
ncbi:MAG: hypothetical protein JXA04_12240 [Gammaproteobacteria bacterium]|nr:hypothetical protein [Gammaproteobacteria bacterium]